MKATLSVWLLGFLISLPVILRTVHRQGKDRQFCGINWYESVNKTEVGLNTEWNEKCKRDYNYTEPASALTRCQCGSPPAENQVNLVNKALINFSVLSHDIPSHFCHSTFRYYFFVWINLVCHL